MAQHTAAAKYALEERREQVAALAAIGATVRQIASRLNVSIGTVSNDMKVIRSAWREQAVEHVNEMVGREAVSLDRLERDLWRDFITTEDIDQRVRVASSILRCKERRAKLFGLDAPDRVELVSEDHVILIDLGKLG